ncbi:MAG: Asp-tRNA(Asn)/Glu-tRNA(Gln) amidotransferase subunit GatA [Actinomycetota bacterium]
MKLYELTSHELHRKLVDREISAEDLVKIVFDRIRQVEPEVKAYVTLMEEFALAEAREVDKKIKAGEEIGPLAGIPTAIKDNMCTKGILTTCSSKILGNYIPIYNGTAVKKVFAQDIVMTGKTNMDEFAMGSSTETSHFGVTRNPWNVATVPGGSSGGSAAAVAAGEAIMALGSDTGGSIRQPASLCGVVGMKPTYGLVSRYGLVAFASSLDQIGPITKDVTDCALLLQAIAGHDPCDTTSIDIEIPDYSKALVADVKGLKIGLLKEMMGEGIQPEVRDSIKKSLDLLASLGAEVKEVSLPHADYALSAYYLIAPAEASSNLARYDGVRYGYRTSQEVKDMVDMYSKTREEGFGNEVKRRIMLGTYALSAGYYEAYYGQAQKVRTLIVEDFNRAFERVDVIASPTSPTVAFKIGEKFENPLMMYLSDVCTIPVNLAGLPGISLPCGMADGLPIGLQLIGKAFDESTLLRVAYTFEQAFGFKEKPNL